MSLHKRLEAVALLGVGSIATISTILRTYFVYRLWKGPTDYSWQVHPAYIASIVEINLGIVSLHSCSTCTQLIFDPRYAHALHTLGH